jgi:hypothetical protein
MLPIEGRPGEPSIFTILKGGRFRCLDYGGWVEERWVGTWNLRKASVFSRTVVFSHTVRGWLSVFSPKLSDECAGRLPIVCAAANSLCHTRRWRQIGNCVPGVFRPFAGLARFLRA